MDTVKVQQAVHQRQVDMDKVVMMPPLHLAVTEEHLADMEEHQHLQQHLHQVLPSVVMTATVPLKVVDMVDNTR